jgi:Tfp pilus assembly protein PilP
MCWQKKTQIVFILGCLLYLTGCDQQKSPEELNNYIAKIKSQAATETAALPEIKLANVKRDKALAARSPFLSTRSAAEPLREFPLHLLHMVGSLRQENKVWALVMTPEGQIYPVAVGMHLDSDGQVVSVSAARIDIAKPANSVVSIAVIDG